MNRPDHDPAKFRQRLPMETQLLQEVAYKYSNPVAARAITLSLLILQACNFFIGLTFLALVNKFSIGQVYLGFAIVCIAAASFVSKFVVETKGKSLEDIEKLMASNV